jgi:hypothetical protein
MAASLGWAITVSMVRGFRFGDLNAAFFPQVLDLLRLGCDPVYNRTDATAA